MLYKYAKRRRDFFGKFLLLFSSGFLYFVGENYYTRVCWIRDDFSKLGARELSIVSYPSPLAAQFLIKK